MTRTMTRIGAALLGLILTAAAALSLMIPAVADEPADPESWMQIAQTIVADLDAGVAEYVDGDHAGAASAFNVAYNTDYVASNFAKVVNDTIGADRYQNQRRQFQDLQRLVYQQNRRIDIETLRDALADDVRECGATLDGNGELSDPRDYARMREEQTAKEREALDAAKVHKNEGIGTRSWSDVATEMVSVLDNSLAASESGDGERGAELVNEAYYQYYEKLGFEKNVMNAIGGSRVSKVESTFKESRKAMVAGDTADAKVHVDELKTMLVEDAAALDGGAGSEVGGFTRLITSSFGQAFLDPDPRGTGGPARRRGDHRLSGQIRQPPSGAVDLPGRRGRSGRIGGHRRGVHGVVRWQRTAAGDHGRRVRARGDGHAAVHQQLDAQQIQCRRVEPVHPGQNRSRRRTHRRHGGHRPHTGTSGRGRHRLARPAELPGGLPRRCRNGRSSTSRSTR